MRRDAHHLRGWVHRSGLDVFRRRCQLRAVDGEYAGGARQGGGDAAGNARQLGDDRSETGRCGTGARCSVQAAHHGPHYRTTSQPGKTMYQPGGLPVPHVKNELTMIDGLPIILNFSFHKIDGHCLYVYVYVAHYVVEQASGEH